MSSDVGAVDEHDGGDDEEGHYDDGGDGDDDGDELLLMGPDSHGGATWRRCQVLIWSELYREVKGVALRRFALETPDVDVDVPERLLHWNALSRWIVATDLVVMLEACCPEKAILTVYAVVSGPSRLLVDLLQ